jgi:putative ABC transport system permease protein
VREAIRTVRSDILVTPRTLQSWIDDGLDTTWRVVVLILGLGVLAMTLAVAGIYGVISFTVSQRTRELGIRVALGAARADIYREVLVAGSRPVLFGLFAGVWLALVVDSAIHNIFLNAPFQTEQGNPVIYSGAALVLGMAALAAMLIPAGRGARSDPMKALHYE